MDILEEEEKRQYSDIEIRDNVEVAKLNLERLTHIRLVVSDLKED